MDIFKNIFNLKTTPKKNNPIRQKIKTSPRTQLTEKERTKINQLTSGLLLVKPNQLTSGLLKKQTSPKQTAPIQILKTDNETKLSQTPSNIRRQKLGNRSELDIDIDIDKKIRLIIEDKIRRLVYVDDTIKLNEDDIRRILEEYYLTYIERLINISNEKGNDVVMYAEVMNYINRLSHLNYYNYGSEVWLLTQIYQDIKDQDIFKYLEIIKSNDETQTYRLNDYLIKMAFDLVFYLHIVLKIKHPYDINQLTTLILKIFEEIKRKNNELKKNVNEYYNRIQQFIKNKDLSDKDYQQQHRNLEDELYYYKKEYDYVPRDSYIELFKKVGELKDSQKYMDQYKLNLFLYRFKVLNPDRSRISQKYGHFLWFINNSIIRF